jgi:hypothetical protein
MRYVIGSLGVFALTLAAASATMTQRAVDASPLRSVAGLEKEDLARLTEGRTIVRTLDGTDDREVAAIGAITLAVPRETFVEALRDLVSFKRGAAIPQIGRFAPKPSVADLSGLTLDATDLRDLRDCRADRCKLHLPREVVDAMHRATTSGPSSTADQRLTPLFKEFLVRRVSDYLAAGRSGLEPYAQRSGVNGPAADIEALLAASAAYARLSPAALDYLRTFSGASLSDAPPAADVEHALYWAKETFGWKPVITLTHWVVGPRSAPRGEPVVGASLQLYASHYIDMSLGLTLVFEPSDPDAARRSCHVVYVNRSRAKATTGLFGSVARRLIESRTRDGLRRHLDALGARFANRPVAP